MRRSAILCRNNLSGVTFVTGVTMVTGATRVTMVIGVMMVTRVATVAGGNHGNYVTVLTGKYGS